MIAALGRDEMHIDLVNDSETPLANLVLEIRGKGDQYQNMRISGGEGEVQYIQELETTFVFLPVIQVGVNRVTLTWR